MDRRGGLPRHQYRQWLRVTSQIFRWRYRFEVRRGRQHARSRAGQQRQSAVTQLSGSRPTYRRHLRTVVSATAAPYGFTLSIWTGGALTIEQVGSFPSTVDALLFVAGAVVGFGTLSALVFGGIDDVLTPTSRAQVRVWGGLHLPALGSSVLACSGLAHTVREPLVWPVVGFTATTVYLAVIAAQYWVASRREADPAEADDPLPASAGDAAR